MSRATIILFDAEDRADATKLIADAPAGTRVTFKGAKRTTEQNDKMWAMLTDLSKQVIWYGSYFTKEDWKVIMLHGLNRELRVAPSIDGRSVVPLGQSSSDLSKEEMSDLIELISAFGAERGVVFRDQNDSPPLSPESHRERERETT